MEDTPMYRRLALALCVSSSPSSAALAAAPARGESLAVSGSGCPEQWSRAELADDGRLDLTFDVNFAQVAAGVPVEEARRDCEVAVRLEQAAGLMVAVR